MRSFASHPLPLHHPQIIHNEAQARQGLPPDPGYGHIVLSMGEDGMLGVDYLNSIAPAVRGLLLYLSHLPGAGEFVYYYSDTSHRVRVVLHLCGAWRGRV